MSDFLERLYEEEMSKKASAEVEELMQHLSADELEVLVGITKVAAKGDAPVQQTHQTGITPLSPAVGALKGGATGALAGAGLSGAALAGLKAARMQGKNVPQLGRSTKAKLLAALVSGAGALGAGGGAALSALKRSQTKSDLRQIKKMKGQVSKEGGFGSKCAGIKGPAVAPLPTGKGYETTDKTKKKPVSVEGDKVEKEKAAAIHWADQTGRMLARMEIEKKGQIEGDGMEKEEEFTTPEQKSKAKVMQKVMKGITGGYKEKAAK